MVHTLPHGQQVLSRFLHDFAGIHATGVPDADGDKAFDDEPLPAAAPQDKRPVISLVQAG